MRTIESLFDRGIVQYKLFAVFIQAVLLCSAAVAGFERNVQPTAIFANAVSGVAMNSFENLWLNPASPASLSSFRASLFYAPSPFQLPQLTHYGLIAAHPFSPGTISIGLYTQGFPLYRESSGSATYAGILTDELSVGMTLNVYHLAIQGYGSATKIGTDIGGILSLSEELSIGFSLGNVNGADIDDGGDIPRTAALGAVFRPVSTAVILFDIVKDIRFPEEYRAGIKFSPIDEMTLHAGMQSEHSRLFAGMSITVSPLTVHYGIGTHADLGVAQSIGITFAP
jgi:hypothetical protein